MTVPCFQLLRTGTGQVVVAHLERADSLWKSARGLLGRERLEPNTGLWLRLMPWDLVHTLGMRFPIDLLVLNREGKAILSVAHLRPWRLVGPIRGGRHAIELPAGTLDAQNLRLGEDYQICDQAGNSI